MQVLTQRLNENHRYFPEWADRPESPGPPLEADHNSYLAGGYSEEFGYRLCADQPPVFAPLEGDPDISRLWYVHITGLHPGYPECARPDDRARDGTSRAGSIHDSDSAGAVRGPAKPFRVIRVGERSRKSLPLGALAARLVSSWTRWRPTHRGSAGR